MDLRTRADLPAGGTEQAPHVADGLDALVAFGEVAELAAQAIDATVDGTVGAVVVEAAQLVEDLVAREHAAGVARKQPEEVEFGAGEIDGRAAQAHFARGEVE